MRILESHTERVAIDALRPHPRNPREGDIGAIHQSIENNGFYGSVIAQKSTGFILAGNHRWQAAQQQGATEIPVTWIDVDDDHALRILLADNRTNDLASYNDNELAELLQTLRDETGTLAGTGYDGDDLDELLDDLGLNHDAGTGDPPEAQTDRADELREKWGTEVGQLWQIGPHRLLCGDSSVTENLDRLIDGAKVGCVLTDPPYGMNLDTDYSKLPGGNAGSGMHKQPKKYRAVIGDDQQFDAAPLREYFAGVKEQFWFGADYYRSTLSPNDRDGSWLVWDKRKEDGSQDDVIGSTFELCWTAQPHQRRLLRHYWCGAFGGPEARDRYHPTQKPVALLAEIIERWAPAGKPVIDPFSGSGGTLLAAEQTGRPGYGIEMDPAYVAVILERFTDAGLTPELAE